jgi:EAL domain-containing protein (putative c-di-GMP-specific phosphodiesterase class I)
MTVRENTRLTILRQLNLLDTPSSESFDRITRLASQLFNLPIAAVSLTDQNRQWFKSRVGVDHWEIPREKACCAEVTDTTSMLVVNDLLDSERYRDSVLANSGIRFYAGAPLLTEEGYCLGAMCVLGTEPREASQQELDALQDLASMTMAQIDLQHALGRIDGSSGLPNFMQFADDLKDLVLDHPGETWHALSIELIDLEHASALQRVMGPEYVEDLSREAAMRLQTYLGDQRRLYHVGTAQFAHLLHGTEASTLEAAVAMRQALMSRGLAGASPFMVRPVVGVAGFRLDTATRASAVLRLAHSASRDAREANQNVGLYSSDADARYQRAFELVAHFGRALSAGDQLRLVYQPRIDIATGACVGAEALLRWRHPLLGDIAPAEFIPLVEKTEMARRMTEWVLRTAIGQSAQWHRPGMALRVAVNVAAVNLEEDDFADRLFALLHQEDLPVDGIELELTEGGLLDQGPVATRQLASLTAGGVRLAIDDFGTGYSSLAYLQQVPAQVVKIDRCFVQGVETNQRGQILVTSMITMAHNLGYTVVAEGVETPAGLALMQTLGCDEVQGYLIAPPLEVNAFERWWRAWLPAHPAKSVSASTQAPPR